MSSPVGMFLLGVGAFVLLLLVTAVLLTLLLGVPWQARRRGHGFWPWFVLQILALNPVYPLIVVAMLPDRAKARARQKFAAELDLKLRAARIAASADAARSIGDAPTVAPEMRSVGDMPTVPPENRSIGDAATQ